MSRVGAFFKHKGEYTPWDFIISGLGFSVLGFALFGLLIIGFQKLVMGMMPATADPGFEHFERMLGIMHGLWLIYMPLMALGGVIAIVGGLLLHADREIGRRMCQLACLYAIGWSIAYTVDTMSVMPTYLRAMQDSAGGGLSLFRHLDALQRPLGVAAWIMMAAMVWVPAVLLLWVLRRKGERG